MSFLSPVAETKELHSDGQLRSRYYKTNYAKAKAVIVEHTTQLNAQVKNVDDVHREIFIQGNRYHIIAFLVQVTPYETSVDFKVEHYGFIGMNRPKKKIIEFYEYLNHNLTFKGVGLHP